VVPGVNRSYATYLAELKKVDERIAAVQDKTAEILKKEEVLTDRLIGELEKGGKPARDKSGSVLRPGWDYLIEQEAQAPRELKKELDYVQPLWVKELVDAQQLISRRETLLRRLNELGDRSYLTQSEFMRKSQ